MLVVFIILFPPFGGGWVQICSRSFETSMESLRREPLSLLGALASGRLADELGVGSEGQPRVRCSSPQQQRQRSQ